MDDRLYLQRCLDLAQRAKGFTMPNPMVGAVLVHNHTIIGEGWHRAPGEDHAEVDCLKQVSVDDQHLVSKSTLYVNLEPCAHYGRTPPCATRIIAENIKKVVIANTDPFTEVNGKGITLLKQAGITVETGTCAGEGRWLNRRFFTFHERKRPYIILKWAQTRDGYLAPANKARFSITNQQSNTLVHKWRTEEGAMLVGTGTALADNPQLTARLWLGKQPVRLVLGRNLPPRSNHLFDNTATTWLLNDQLTQDEQNVHFQMLDFSIDVLPQVWALLYSNGIQSVIVEGGRQLLDSCITGGWWDEARIFTGNTLLGDGLAAPLLTHATPAFEGPLGDDRLEVFTRLGSGYQWPAGMPL